VNELHLARYFLEDIGLWLNAAVRAVVAKNGEGEAAGCLSLRRGVD